jgi:hypothetical protein
MARVSGVPVVAFRVEGYRGRGASGGTIDHMIERRDDGVVVTVWVSAGAGGDAVGGEHAGALRVRTAAPPERGRANKAVVDLLVRAFGARRGSLVGGEGHRRKRILLEGVPWSKASEVAARLTAGG